MLWQIYGVWISLAVSLVGLSFIVWAVEPRTATALIKVLFFVTIFILFWSASTAIIFSIKNRLVKSRALGEIAYEPIFYDSFFNGLIAAAILMTLILIKRIF